MILKRIFLTSLLRKCMEYSKENMSFLLQSLKELKGCWFKVSVSCYVISLDKNLCLALSFLTQVYIKGAMSHYLGIFVKNKQVPWHQLNSKTNRLYLLLKTILWH